MDLGDELEDTIPFRQPFSQTTLFKDNNSPGWDSKSIRSFRTKHHKFTNILVHKCLQTFSHLRHLHSLSSEAKHNNQVTSLLGRSEICSTSFKRLPNSSSYTAMGNSQSKGHETGFAIKSWLILAVFSDFLVPLHAVFFLFGCFKILWCSKTYSLSQRLRSQKSQKSSCSHSLDRLISLGYSAMSYRFTLFLSQLNPLPKSSPANCCGPVCQLAALSSSLESWAHLEKVFNPG